MSVTPYGWLVFASVAPPAEFGFKRAKSGKVWYRRFPRGGKGEANRCYATLLKVVGDDKCWFKRKCRAKTKQPETALARRNGKAMGWLNKRRLELTDEDRERFADLKQSFKPAPRELGGELPPPLSDVIPSNATKPVEGSSAGSSNTRLPR